MTPESRSPSEHAIEVTINPRGIVTPYLTHLNACFLGWGDRARYAWVFERSVLGPPADVMLLSIGPDVHAGSAVTYRRASIGEVDLGLVGIMTGSWTLPAARGRGCFTRVISESVSCCRARGAHILLAFVTEDNASYRRLRDAGATLFPTQYWLAPATETAVPATQIHPTVMTASELVRSHAARPGTGLRFLYDVEAYRGQFLARPLPVETVESADGVALVERAIDTDRVLAFYPSANGSRALVAALLARAHGRSRALFGFSSDPAHAAAFEAVGIAARRGFVAALSTGDPNALAMVDAVALENGDRM